MKAEFYDKAGNLLGTPIKEIRIRNGPCEPIPDLLFPEHAQVVGISNLVRLRPLDFYIDNNIHPLEFYEGTNFIGSVNMGAGSLVITNLPLGTHVFSARTKDLQGRLYIGRSETVTVTRVEIQDPKFISGTKMSFLVTGAVPHKRLTIEWSTNLNTWREFEVMFPTNRTIRYTNSIPFSSKQYLRAVAGEASPLPAGP